MIKTLDRYVVREMVGPFAFGVGLFTLLFFSAETLGGVTRLMVESQTGLEVIARYLLYRLPQALVFTFPMAVMLSALLTFGRLSADHELTALKASGIGFLRVATPALAFCAAASAVGFWLSDTVAPAANRQALNLLLEHQGAEQLQNSLISLPRVLPNGQVQVSFILMLNTRTREATGVYVHYSYNNVRRREIYAQKARWNGRAWEFRDVTVVDYDEQGRPVAEATSAQGWSTLTAAAPPTPQELLQRRLRPEEMTRAQLAEALRQLPQSGESPERLARETRKYLMSYHQKLAIPLACFIFGLFAVPLGVRPQRTSTSIGLGLSLVFILLYYVLMTLGAVLGESGATSPLWGAWLPNLFFGVLGAGLLAGSGRT
jgi:lipopolysaccharide export system permease protein